jgi:hypothetical protein
VTLSVVDSQGTEDNGVMITVIGHLSTKRDPSPRKFIQTFILAVQKEPRGFYIRNDIFRFLKQDAFDLPTAGRFLSINMADRSKGQEKLPASVEPTPQPEKIEVIQPVVQVPQSQATPAPQPAPKEVESPKEVPVAQPKQEVEQKPVPEKKELVQEKAAEKPAQPAPEKKEDKKEEKTEQPVEKKPQAEKKPKQQKPKEEKPKKQEEKKPEKEKAPEKPSVPSWANVIVSGPGVNPPPQVVLQMQKEKEEEKKQEKKEKKPKDDQGTVLYDCIN